MSTDTDTERRAELAGLAERWGAESYRDDHGPSAAAGMRTITEYVHLRLSRIPDEAGRRELLELAARRPTDVAASYRAGYLSEGA